MAIAASTVAFVASFIKNNDIVASSKKKPISDQNS